ncbi:MAG: hypothetical protein E5W83_36160, partial [Mesorhizobium sp.]
MKKLLLASVIAIASAASMIPPANAGVSIGIGTGYDDDYYVPRYRTYDTDDDDSYYRRDVYDEEDYRPRYYHRYNRRCHVEYVKHWRHHHRIVEKIRV